MKRSEYLKYLASREWALLKEKLRRRSGGKCERCALGDYEETHHLTYERVGHESSEDLLAVCSRCHEFLSGKSNFDPARERLPIEKQEEDVRSGFTRGTGMVPGQCICVFAGRCRGSGYRECLCSGKCPEHPKCEEFTECDGCLDCSVYDDCGCDFGVGVPCAGYEWVGCSCITGCPVCGCSGRATCRGCVDCNQEKLG